jgi:hypothetical protein
MTCAVSTLAAQEIEYQNLQVLPVDISRAELGDVMLDNLRGLGPDGRSIRLAGTVA